MKITFLTVGKNTDRKIEELIGRYTSRLTHYVKFDIKALPDIKASKGLSVDKQKQLEGASILGCFAASDYVILLDERGDQLTSRGFAELLEQHLVRGTRDLYFVVGGPFGFSQDVYNRADRLMSLSRMTLTHEMVRLFFVEQVYRAFTIIKGESYHHD